MVPQAYVKWLEKVKKFYSVAISDTDIQAKLARLKFTTENLTFASNTIYILNLPYNKIEDFCIN